MLLLLRSYRMSQLPSMLLLAACSGFFYQIAVLPLALWVSSLMLLDFYPAMSSTVMFCLILFTRSFRTRSLSRFSDRFRFQPT
ncbi:hypothetical protein TNCT_137811 [Trichonephila clavata]|uniref:Uncharacterized protein n=1 Tax=Trichonephila clavata TaxID=2740835 RepID=A0A8X6HPD3_TRICU|nr:hypothetical protein TNCT_137811 [Trichonephila clavata]